MRGEMFGGDGGKKWGYSMLNLEFKIEKSGLKVVRDIVLQKIGKCE